MGSLYPIAGQLNHRIRQVSVERPGRNTGRADLTPSG